MDSTFLLWFILFMDHSSSGYVWVKISLQCPYVALIGMRSRNNSPQLSFNPFVCSIIVVKPVVKTNYCPNVDNWLAIRKYWLITIFFPSIYLFHIIHVATFVNSLDVMCVDHESLTWFFFHFFFIYVDLLILSRHRLFITIGLRYYI